MNLRETLSRHAAGIRLVDTHEHLIEESRRLVPPRAGDPLFPCDDWALLLAHYAVDDLRSAGMTESEQGLLLGTSASPKAKWRAVAPAFQRARNTGYLQAARISARELFGVEDIREDTVETITERLRAHAKPGFYRKVLRETAGIDWVQVNSLEGVFSPTAQPDLLQQDLNLVNLAIELDFSLAVHAGVEVRTLADWHKVIEWHFLTYGPRAVAVKSAHAYNRRLDHDGVTAADAARPFEAWRAGHFVAPAEKKAVQDHLFHHCVRWATRLHLPVKLHTGYHVWNNRMPLARVRDNASDLCSLLQAHPEARFVLMHTGYPYGHELLALAKHYDNVWLDLCWAWIIDPIATRRFVVQAVGAVPFHKILGFRGGLLHGGDLRGTRPDRPTRHGPGNGRSR